MVRVWEYASGRCLGVLCGHVGGICAVDFDGPGHRVLAVGQDVQRRQSMVVWDVMEMTFPNLAHPPEENESKTDHMATELSLSTFRSVEKGADTGVGSAYQQASAKLGAKLPRVVV